VLGQETGTNEVKVFDLPPAMALDVASSYLLTKARLSLAEQQMEAMQAKGKTTELLGQLAVLLRRDDEGNNLTLLRGELKGVAVVGRIAGFNPAFFSGTG